MATITNTPIKVFVSGETVTPAKLNELSQSTVALTAGSIVATDIASDAVTTAKILDANVTTAKVADATSTTTGVTNSKLRHSAALSVIGRGADSAGAPADIAAANDGEVFRRSGTSVGFGTVATAGIANAAVTPAKLSQPLTLGTSQAATSGASIDFTGIPSWAKRVTLLFSGVSTSGTNNKRIRLGVGGSFVTSGYVTTRNYITTAILTGTSTAGFDIETSGQAAELVSGQMVFTNITGNSWVGIGQFSATNGNQPGAFFSGGNIALSGALDSIRLTTVNGTDTFDAGSVNIMYEG
jgi:hypothetical protein